MEYLRFHHKPEGGPIGDENRFFYFTQLSKATFVMRGLWNAVVGNKEKAAFDLTNSQNRLVGFGAVIPSEKYDVNFKSPDNCKGWYILANMSREELSATLRKKNCYQLVYYLPFS